MGGGKVEDIVGTERLQIQDYYVSWGQCPRINF